MKRSIRGLCVVLVVFMAHVGFAAEAPQNLVVVRPESFWPPQEMLIDGELAGIHIELVREVARSLNLSVTFETYPWKRAIQMLKNGETDAITYMSKTDEREQFGYFFEGNVISKASIGFFILKKHEDEIHFSGDLKSLQAYTIGTCRGFSYDEAFDQATYLTKDDGAANEETLLMKVLDERTKIAIGYVNDIKYAAKRMGVAEQIVFLRPYLSEGRAIYVVFSKAKPYEELAKRFSDAMEAFKSTAQYDDLMKKYGIEAE